MLLCFIYTCTCTNTTTFSQAWLMDILAAPWTLNYFFQSFDGIIEGKLTYFTHISRVKKGIDQSSQQNSLLVISFPQFVYLFLNVFCFLIIGVFLSSFWEPQYSLLVFQDQAGQHPTSILLLNQINFHWTFLIFQSLPWSLL